MSNPIATTVRGWLEQIYTRLAPTTESAELLSELRLLNRRLWGVDATGAIQAEPLEKLLRDSLLFSMNVGPNPPTIIPLSQFLLNKYGDTSYEPPWETAYFLRYHLNRIDSHLTPLDEGETIPYLVNELLNFQQRIVSMLREPNSTMTDAQAAYLKQLLDATGKLSEIAPDLTIRGALQAISMNTLRAADCCEDSNGGGGDNTQPPFENDCVWQGTVYQPINFVNLGLIGGGDEPDQDKWTFDLNFTSEPFIGARQVVNGVVTYQLVAPQDGNLEVCIVWNTTGETGQTALASLDYSDTRAGASDLVWTPPPYDRPDIGSLSYSLFIDVPPGQARFIGLQASTLVGVQASSNVWFKMRIAPT